MKPVLSGEENGWDLIRIGGLSAPSLCSSQALSPNRAPFVRASGQLLAQANGYLCLQISGSPYLVHFCLFHTHPDCAKHSSSTTSWNYHIDPGGKYQCQHHLADMETKASETVVK